MTTQKKGATLLGLPDRFVAVEIETEAAPAFDAAQYSFFGDLSAADTGLEGALEDDLEGLQDGLGQEYRLHAAEEGNSPLDGEEDLSVASIFRNQLGLGPAKTPTKREDPDDDAGLDALLTDPLSVARKQLRDDDYDQRELPVDLYHGTMAGSAVNQSQSLFGTPVSQYSLFDGYSGMLGSQAVMESLANVSSAALTSLPLQQPQPSPQAPSVPGSALLQMLKQPSQLPVRAMTLEELEARMFGNAAATVAPAGGSEAPGAAAAAGRMPGSGGFGSDTASASGPNHHQQLQQQAAALLVRPLPGMPAGSGGGSARGPSSPGPPRMSGVMGGPPPQLPPGAFPLQMQQTAPPGVHGFAPPGMQMQPHQHQLHHMHGAPAPHGPMQMNMMMQQQQQLGPPGPGMYPPPPMMGPGHMGTGPQNLMYNGNGMMPPPPPQHHHHHAPGPGMMPQGPMASLPYGPGGMYQPRGPMPPYGPGPMGMGGQPPPYMHDGYPMRPMGPPPGMQGPMHGIPPRPGPFGYGPSAMGPGPGPQQQQQLAPPGSQRPFMLAGPPPPPSGSGPQRLGPVLGPGAQPRPAAQARQGGGAQGPSEFGQQLSRVNGASAAGPIALAAAAAAAGRAGGAPSGPGGRLGGKWMRPEDVEYVVRSMLYTVANGVPYVEDYYYQAFVHKHVSQPSRQQLSPGAFPMAAPFVPEALRELSEDQMSMIRLDPSSRAKFVEGLQGLGKIVLSNIRTPKVLMDLSDRGVKGGDARARASTGAGEGSADVGKGSDQQQGRGARPLEQEPLLAARIMIEDCMNLLLDMDDIDRLANHMAALAQAQQRAAAVAAVLPGPGAGHSAVAAAAAAAASPVGPYGPSSLAPPPATQLRPRRELLLAGINGAFRLPNSPRGAAASGGLSVEGSMDLDSPGASRIGGSLGDGVLIRILALTKGRGIVARALLAIAPPASLVVAPPPAKPSPARQSQTGKAGSAAAAAAEGNGNGGSAPTQEDGPAAGAGANEAGGDSLLGADAPSPFTLLWGTLRNAWMVFGSSLQQDLDAATERPFLESTARLAAALREALLRLPTPRDVVAAAAAFNAGCQQHVEAMCQGNTGSMEATLMPLAQTRAVEAAAAAAPAAWLGEALAALVTRASQLGLATAAAASEEGDADAGGSDAVAKDGEAGSREPGGVVAGSVAAEWRREYAALQERVSRHLAALGGIQTMAAASGNAEALAVVRSLSCRLLVNAMLQHASAEQAQELKAALTAMAV